MGVEYLEDGILFCGHFLAWEAGLEEVQTVAISVALAHWCQPQTVERIIGFELKRPA